MSLTDPWTIQVADCEEKIRNMEGALSLRILDQNNSRGNSRASSRAAMRHGKFLLLEISFNAVLGVSTKRQCWFSESPNSGGV
jgi:hypothetical protein